MSDSQLFQPLPVGNLKLNHRVVMAPLTRFRADDEHVPVPLMAEYYGQRASTPGTLLITEATFISQQAAGYANVPGIWSSEQIAGWKRVTDAVHAKGSYIFCQLWALGRVAVSSVAAKEGIAIKAPSPIRLDNQEGLVEPQEMTEADIKSFVADYAKAARNAVEAGFDGVELHGANGYLVDQFIQDVTNTREDGYGGNVENRSRFALEILQALVEAVGKEKVGMRLSPWSPFQGMRMHDPVPQFSHLVKEAGKLGLAYLHLVESRIMGNADREATEKNDFALKVWWDVNEKGTVFLAGGFKPETARAAVDKEFKGRPVAVVFGRYFISSPDLPYRLRKGIEPSPYNRDTFYNAKSPVGYVDYPFSKEWVAETAAA